MLVLYFAALSIVKVWDTLAEQGIVNKFGMYNNRKADPNPKSDP